MVSSLNRWA